MKISVKRGLHFEEVNVPAKSASAWGIIMTALGRILAKEVKNSDPKEDDVENKTQIEIRFELPPEK